ncbi:MAG TPA: hypothetical protein VGD43_15015 [Micromonospora sp.]
MRISKIPVTIAVGVLAVTAALVPAGAASASGSDKGASTESYSCGYYSGTELTQYGDTGNRVKEVQCLINLGFYPYYLTVDGKVGPITWYQLRNNPNC